MKPFLDADYAAIEARIVCWLAGEEDALQEYRMQDAATTPEDKARLDRYRIMASEIFGVPVAEVNKHPQRFVGKNTILGCGFQAGGGAIEKQCLRQGGYKMPIGLADTAVASFRAKHKKIVRYWTDVEKTAQRAITNRGQVLKLRNISFLCRDVEGMLFLFIKLPSGRKLAYPQPRLVPSRFEGKTAIAFHGRLGTSTAWGRCDTYGGKLVENITQAVAADIMANGVHNAENKGYETATLIHDQDLSYFFPERGQTPEEFVELLTTLPAWAEGLPITAEGGLVPFYKKD